LVTRSSLLRGLALPWRGRARRFPWVLFAFHASTCATGCVGRAAGLALWYALGKGGVDPTIAGVFLGLRIPRSRPRRCLDTLPRSTSTPRISSLPPARTRPGAAEC